MRKLPYLFAVAVVSGLALSASPGSASPLTGGLASGSATVPEVTEGLVQNVHYRTCRIMRYYDEDGDLIKKRRCSRHYHRPGVFFGAPFVGLRFGFDDDDDHHRDRWHHNNKKYKTYKKSY